MLVLSSSVTQIMVVDSMMPNIYQTGVKHDATTSNYWSVVKRGEISSEIVVKRCEIGLRRVEIGGRRLFRPVPVLEDCASW